MNNARSLIVGLTGGVASGKSLASKCFRELNVPVLDADQVARTVVEPGSSALVEIGEQFGTSLIDGDGRLDRRKLREIVFGDPQKLRELEAITHPRIRAEILAWLADQRSPYCVLENAILLESGMDALVDRVLVIDVSEKTQRARLSERDAIDSGLIDSMLAAQYPRKKRLNAADDVIENEGSIEQLRSHVSTLHCRYMEARKLNNLTVS